jgi:DNA ligase (NAD+)
MSKADVKKRIEKLRAFLKQWNHDYFIENKTAVSEAARDQMKRELEDLEKQYPELITPDSPTQRIGAPLSGKLQKVRHKVRKQSLQDVFSWEEIEKWQERLQKILPNAKFHYITELKIDGLNISLWYEQGKYVKALTRGDGEFGEDVTHTVRTIDAIPLELGQPLTMEVTGEVYMSKKAFEQLNQAEAALGAEEGFVNPRNTAAGTIRQLDPSIAARRNLSAFFYLLNGEERLDQGVLLETLQKLGFPIESHWRLHDQLETIKTFIDHWAKKRDRLPYHIDGIVVKVNGQDHQERLGSTARAPRWAVAYKFPAEQSTSIVENIVIQVGRTGAITPVAELKPTFLDGSTVSRATLHNEDELKRKDVRVGDTVIIRKAGDIIPEVVQVLKEMRTGREHPFVFPKKCPGCGHQLARVEGEVIQRCPNDDCPAKTREQLYHFVSKKGFDIDALGQKIIDQLIDRSLIVTPADIFHLGYEEIYSLDLFEKKRTENLLAAIERAKLIPLSRFLFSLGIRHIGEQTARDLVPELQKDLKYHRSSKKLQSGEQGSLFLSEDNDHGFEYISPEELGKSFIRDPQKAEKINSVEGMGDKVTAAFIDWFEKKEHQNLLHELSEYGVYILKEENINEHDPLFDSKTFVITGSFENFSRDELKAIVLRRGGKVSSAVTSKTSVVMVGNEPGSKLKKAQELQIEVWDEGKIEKILEMNRYLDELLDLEKNQQ